MVVQYKVPNQVIEKFKERGKSLAFLAGHKDDHLVTVSHLIIPSQNEFRTEIDQGNLRTVLWSDYQWNFLEFFRENARNI